MNNIQLNTTFIVLLVITLILYTFYYIIDSAETNEVDNGNLKKVTGVAQSFEVYDEYSFSYEPTKKNTERYNDKLFDYLEHIQERRDETFLR